MECKWESWKLSVMLFALDPISLRDSRALSLELESLMTVEHRHEGEVQLFYLHGEERVGVYCEEG